MTATYLGSFSLGAALPGVQAGFAAGAAGINAALPDILARIASLQAFAPQPVSFAAQLQLAQQVVASIQQSITLGLSPPSIAAQIAAVTALISELLASVTAVQGQLAIVADLTNLLGAAGVHAVAFEGRALALGADVTSELVGHVAAGDNANAIVLVTTVSETWAALSQLFKVTP